MDRLMVYPGAIPLDTDVLSVERNVMTALGWMTQATFGTTVGVVGLPCTPTVPATMTVNVGPGAIWAQAQIDQSAFGSLPANRSALMKMGILPEAAGTNFTLTAPTNSGQSINYLIEAAFEETDENPVVLPYVNPSNPAQPYTGPDNAGTPQNTVRAQVVNLQLKAGVAANAGTQATPSVDSGYVGLYVITVNYGQNTITSADITQYENAPFAGGPFAQLGGNANQAFAVAAATEPNQAPQLGQLSAVVSSALNGVAEESWVEQNYAPIAGNTNQPFSVGPATQPTQAPQLGQVQAQIADSVAGLASETWSQGQFLPLSGGTLSDELQINPQATNVGLLINAPNNPNGACILFTGNGSTATNKYIKVSHGNFCIVNDAYTDNIFQLDDDGNIGDVNSVALNSPATAANQAPQLGQVEGLIQPYNFLLNGLAQDVSMITDCNEAPMGFSLVQLSNATPGTVQNGPPNSRAGLIYTFSTDGTPPSTNNNWVTQYYYDPNEGPIPFIRNNINNQGWSAWQQFSTLQQTQSWVEGRTFVSAPQPLTYVFNGNVPFLTIPHNLGAVPSCFGFYLVNTTAELGYNVGDVAGALWNDNNNASASNPVRANATNLILATGLTYGPGEMGSYGTEIAVIDEVDSLSADWRIVTAANWSIILWAKL